MDTTADGRPEELEAEKTQALLRDDLRTLRADLDTLAGDVAAIGLNQLDRVRTGAAELARAGEVAVQEVDDRLGAAVRERPIQSLALAFFAGYVFSALSR